MSFIQVIQGLQLLTSLILVKDQIEIQLIKSTIQSLVSKHEDQFKAIKDIYDKLMSINRQSILSDSISKINDSLLLTWDVIAKDFNEKVQLTKKLTSQFKDVQPSKYDFTLQDGIFISFSSIATISQINHILTPKEGVAVESSEVLMKEAKGSMMKEPIIVQKIKVTDGQSIDIKEGEVQMKKGFTKPKGSIQNTSEVEVSGKIQSALQAPAESSIWSKMKNFGSKVGSGLMKAFRCLGVLVLIFGIYQQQKQIISLLGQLKNMKEQYGEEGKFKIKQLQIINFIIVCGQHFSNLAYASYACLQLMSNTYSMMALTFSGFNSLLINKSIEYSPSSTQLNIQFCQASNKFYKDLCSIDVHQKSSDNEMKNSLQLTRNYLHNYITIHNPMKVFDNLAKSIGRYSIDSSIFLLDALVKQTTLTDFNVDLAQLFIERNTELKDYPLSFKEIDQLYVVQVINRYFRLVKNLRPDEKQKSILTYKYLADVNEEERKIIGGIVASFTNTIFSESADGKKLFDKDLSTYKANKTYGQMLDSSYSTPNSFPMIFKTEAQKKEYIENFKSKFLKQPNVDPSIQVYDEKKYFIEETLPIIYWREINGSIQSSGKKYNKMQFIKKIIFKVKSIEHNEPHQIVFEQAGQSWKGQLLKL